MLKRWNNGRGPGLGLMQVRGVSRRHVVSVDVHACQERRRACMATGALTASWNGCNECSPRASAIPVVESGLVHERQATVSAKTNTSELQGGLASSRRLAARLDRLWMRAGEDQEPVRGAT